MLRSLGGRRWIAASVCTVAALFTIGTLLGCNGDTNSDAQSEPVEQDPAVKQGGIHTVAEQEASVSGGSDRGSKGAGDAHRIVGGAVDRYPDTGWVTSLHHDQRGYTCAGSLVTRRFVLTAAHCTDGEPAARWSVQVGSKHYSRGGAARRVAQVFEFPEYGGPPRYYGDMALLRLNRRVGVRPVRLVRRGQHFVESVGYVAGWGTMTDRSPEELPAWLLSVWIPIQYDEFCQQYRDMRRFDGTVMLCAGDTVRNTCRGDSGGPLAVRLAQGWRLVGVTSWGPKCDTRPGAYAWVGSPVLRRWLRRYVGI